MSGVGNLTASALTDSLAKRRAPEGSLGVYQIDHVLAVPQRVLGILPCPRGPLQIDLFRTLGGIGKDDHPVVDDLDEPAEDDQRFLGRALLDPQLAMSEQRDQRSVTREDTERAFGSRCHDHVHTFPVIDNSLTCNDFDRQLGHLPPFLPDPDERSGFPNHRSPGERRPD